MDKFGLDRNDFESYKEYRKAYLKLYRQTDEYKLSQQKYWKSEKGKLVKQRHNQTDKRKLSFQRYAQSEKGKLAKEKWAKSKEGKEWRDKYNQSEKGKLALDAANAKYRQENKGLCNARVSKIRAGKACPPWADLDAITEIYKNCPVGKEVDHDYALKGENFSGLHIPENLQYLTPSENRSKCHKHV